MSGVPEWARRRQVIGLAIAVVAIVGAVGFSNWQDRNKEDDLRVRPTSAVHEVLYHVEGTAEFASVTYATGTGSSQAEVELPMRNGNGDVGVTISARTGTAAYISAQNSGDSGMVTCRITVDGRVVSENTSTAAFGVAQCDASVG